MRVISGSAKGTKLKCLKGQATRPTSDRVKESVFNILTPHLINAKVLDLFSGTGNLGIEAVSRGAENAYLVEKSKKCYVILKENVFKTKLEHKIKIIIEDVLTAIRKFGNRKEKFDIIFMDPPYLKGLILPCLEEIKKNQILNKNGIIVVEHDIKDVLPEKTTGLMKYREKKYGNTIISFYIEEE